MLIYTPLPSYGSSTVLSSPLLLFRKHNIIVSPAASPSIDVPEPRRLVADVACGVEDPVEIDRLATHAMLKMRNHRRARQRIRWIADSSMTVGHVRHLIFVPV
jgi:hypothetical protein